MATRTNDMMALLALVLSASACAGSQGGKSANGTAGDENQTDNGGKASGGANGQGSTGGTNAHGGSASGGKNSGGKNSGGSAGSMTGMPMEIPPRSPPGSCGLEKPAFCENFEKKSPGGRGGHLDESMWAFTRWGHQTRQHFVRNPASQDTERTIIALFCGKPFKGLLQPDDVQICDGTGVDGLTSGQLNEVYDDQGDFALNSFHSRQLFDFTDRTGTVVFDVDAKVNPMNLGHGWWVEFWITEDSAPAPYHEAPSVTSYPRAGVGINFQGLNDCPQGREATSIARVFVSKDYQIVHDYPGWELDLPSDEDRCITTADEKLNHFEIKVNKDQLEVWASDAGSMDNFHRLATAKMLDLSFTRGYVHFQHSAYNAPKDGDVTGVQTYRWDNIGFDGPSYAVPRVYDVPDNDEGDIDETGGRLYGYYFKSPEWISKTISDVDLTKAVGAQLDFNVMVYSKRTLQYRLNGGTVHDYQMQEYGRGGLGTYSLPLELDELKDGDNTLDVRLKDPGDLEEYFGNAELAITLGK
jgi:hypothetical protein